MTTSGLSLIDRAHSFGTAPAIVDPQGSHSYLDLLRISESVAAGLLDGRHDLRERRVAFLVSPGFEYVAALWGIWRAGGIGVPLCTSHPEPELEYVLEDSGASAVIADSRLEKRGESLCARLGIEALSIEALGTTQRPASLPLLHGSRKALILYTSGTTSRPKGVVLTHRNIESQTSTLVGAWGWSGGDRILHVLPLHHTHGIVNALLCPLWAGAVCEFPGEFNPEVVWDLLSKREISLFMAVPTIYIKLLRAWWNAQARRRQKWSRGCGGLRLMVSGSAALPVSVFEEWRAISSHTLLERYGMTEIGMALSNPLDGERRAGFVGKPLPGVDVRMTDDLGGEVSAEGESGILEVRGPGVFREYWGRPEASRSAFRDGWFVTGDVAIVENGYYRIQGRSSVDIIKTGGYKVSALEIEEVLRTHPLIRDCAVVGLEHAEWGEQVSVAVEASGALSIEDLKAWARERLARYKVPTRLVQTARLPRNALGKVVKPLVKDLFG